jgi:hypothetical protein
LETVWVRIQLRVPNFSNFLGIIPRKLSFEMKVTVPRRNVEIAIVETIHGQWFQGKVITDWLRDPERLAIDCVQDYGATLYQAAPHKVADTGPWRGGDILTAL